MSNLLARVYIANQCSVSHVGIMQAAVTCFTTNRTSCMYTYIYSLNTAYSYFIVMYINHVILSHKLYTDMWLIWYI